MDWLFQGLGTLLVGIILGATGDRLYINASRKKSLRMTQKAGRNSNLSQVGRDSYTSVDPQFQRSGGSEQDSEV